MQTNKLEVARFYSEAEMEEIREATFRAGFDTGAEEYQREATQRPYLTEDEAWARHCAGQPAAASVKLMFGPSPAMLRLALASLAARN